MKNLAASLLALSLTVAAAQAPAEPHPDKLVHFNLPAQPLNQALNNFAHQADLRIVFDTADAEGLDAPALNATLTPDEALQKLLDPTGLRAEYLDSKTIAIRKNIRTISRAWDERGNEGDRGGGLMHLAQNMGEGAQNPAFSAGNAEGARSSDEGSKDDLQLEEVIVTAQKREERLQDVPISVGVLTGEYLDSGSSRGVTEVLTQVGGVSVTENAPGTAQIAIRGVLSAIDAGTSAVGFYLDETPFSSVNSGRLPDTNAFDLQRIEVLRGPQGTLYGANALSGVVRVITNDADLNDRQVRGRLRGSQTEHGGENFQGDLAVNLPIVPGVLAARAVIGHSDQSGYIDTLADGGRDANDSEITAYRLKANYQPTDKFSLEFGYNRSEMLNGAENVGFANHTTARTSNQFVRRYLDVYNLTAHLDLSGVSFLSSTSYSDATSSSRLDLTPTFPVFSEAGSHAFTQEFRAASNLDGPWQWTAGVFYRDSFEHGNTNAQPIIPGAIIVDTDSSSWAAFGELTRPFADDKFNLTFGARYFEDTITQTHIQNLFNTPVTPRGTVKFDKITWRLVGTYRPNEDLTMYGSVATGFRSGRFQSTAALALFPDLSSVKPDSLITYEVGAKGNLSDKFAYDIAAYYTDWKDIQQQYAVPLATVNVLAFLNAGRASGPGVDATLNYRPIDELRLGFSLGWNDLTLNENLFASAGTPPAPLLLFRKGGRPNDSPEWTGSFNAEYRTPAFGGDLELVLTGNYTISTKRIVRALTGSTVTERFSDSYSLLNTSLGIEGDRWSLSIFADNLLDEDASVGTPFVGYADESVHARPRTIGVQTNFRF